RSLPGLRQSDSAGLFAACGFLTCPAALQSSSLPLMHRLLHFLLCLLAVSGHLLFPLPLLACKMIARRTYRPQNGTKRLKKKSSCEFCASLWLIPACLIPAQTARPGRIQVISNGSADHLQATTVSFLDQD